MPLADSLSELLAKGGTWPMQVILLLGLIFLWMDGQRKHRENVAIQREMTTERKERIDMLIEVIKEDTAVKTRMEAALGVLGELVKNNTTCIREFLPKSKR